MDYHTIMPYSSHIADTCASQHSMTGSVRRQTYSTAAYSLCGSHACQAQLRRRCNIDIAMHRHVLIGLSVRRSLTNGKRQAAAAQLSLSAVTSLSGCIDIGCLLHASSEHTELRGNACRQQQEGEGPASQTELGADALTAQVLSDMSPWALRPSGLTSSTVKAPSPHSADTAAGVKASYLHGRHVHVASVPLRSKPVRAGQTPRRHARCCADSQAQVSPLNCVSPTLCCLRH